MSDRTLYAAFFLPLADRSGPVARRYAEQAGMDELDGRPGADPGADLVSGVWADMYCTASTFDLQYFTVLAIGFPQSGYFDLLGRAPNGDRESVGSPLVTDFVGSCVALRPFFAMVTAFPRDDLPAYCAELEDPVIAGDADSLLFERLMLTYLTDPDAARISAPTRGGDPLPVSGGGVVIFAGKSADR